MPVNKSNRRLLPLVTVLLCLHTAGFAATQPNTGSILNSLNTPGPTAEKTAPGIEIGRSTSEQPLGETGTKIKVTALRITGQTLYSEDKLLELVKDGLGQEFTVSQLQALAGRITQYFRDNGYLVATAYIPPQTVQEGTVEIAVLVGRYGNITLKNHSGLPTASAFLHNLKSGDYIEQHQLERALLILNDLAGIQTQATLAPGTASGTADLTLTVSDTAKTSGVFYSDNWGNRSTGQIRYGAQTSINNLSGSGDSLTLGGLTTRDGLDNYNLGYSVPLGANGAKLDISYSHVNYTLGDSFASLGATGRATVAGYKFSYPLQRSRNVSLYTSFGYEHKQLRDDIIGYGTYNPRTSGLWSLGLSGRFADTWLGGGTTAFSLTHYRGNLDITDPAALRNDTLHTNGHFAKTVLTGQRRQAVAANLAFTLNFTGQLADKNLDSSEKLYLGGADGVRAYLPGEGGGDQGYKLTGELSWRLPGASVVNNNLYLNTFYDYGHITVNKKPDGTAANHRSLGAVGLGLLWVRDNDFTVRLDYAWKTSHSDVASDSDKNGRCWLQAVKYF